MVVLLSVLALLLWSSGIGKQQYPHNGGAHRSFDATRKRVAKRAANLVQQLAAAAVAAATHTSLSGAPQKLCTVGGDRWLVDWQPLAVERLVKVDTLSVSWH